jgi:diamine N-acetyltransferase
MSPGARLEVPVEERRDERLHITIEGNLIGLGPMRRDLVPTYQRWHNGVATARTYALPLPTRLEQEETLYAELTAASDKAFFTVYERLSWRAVGMTYLTDIDHRHRSAEFGVLIGEAVSRGKGYGTETATLMLDVAFTALGLHSVMLTVYEFNQAGRRAYEKAGFREVGHRRQSHWMGGHYWDEIMMDCLATEFTSPVLSRVFVPDASRARNRARASSEPGSRPSPRVNGAETLRPTLGSG